MDLTFHLVIVGVSVGVAAANRLPRNAADVGITRCTRDDTVSVLPSSSEQYALTGNVQSTVIVVGAVELDFHDLTALYDDRLVSFIATQTERCICMHIRRRQW